MPGEPLLTASVPKNKRSHSLPHAVAGSLAPSSVATAFLAVLAVGFGVLLLYLLQEIVLLLLLGLFLATVIDPGVQRLEALGLPRSIAVLLHYLVFLGLATFLFFSLVPILAQQIAGVASLSTAEIDRFLHHPTVSLPFVPAQLNDQLSLLLQSTLQQLSIQKVPDALRELSASLSTIALGSLQFATDLAASTVRFLIKMGVVMLFTFFFEMERDRTLPWLLQFLTPSQRRYAEHKLSLIYAKLSQWAKGQVILCLIIGTMVFIVLTIFRVQYALTLAILAGFTEFIPYIGPLIAAVPGVLIALSQGGFGFMIMVAVAYYAVQWCENNFIVPLVMKHAVEISPVAVMFAMLVGVSFPSFIPPVLGILLSIPVAAIIGIFLDDLRRKPSKISPE